MALLYRFVRIPDRANSHVFTFIVTRSVTRDIERDITSREFSCGHQRWAITFSRSDKVLGVYLVWKSTSDYMRVYVDFSFTILNREHFSVNEGFTGKQVKFTVDCPAQGSRSYIHVSDLYSRHFTDQNGEFQLELSMGHVRTVLDTEFRIPTGFLSFARGAGIRTGTKVPSKIESPCFSFAGFQWNLALYPHTTKEGHPGEKKNKLKPSWSPHRRLPDLQNLDTSALPKSRYNRSSSPTSHGCGEGRVSFYLNRCTGFDHQCRVRYSVALGNGDHRVESGIVDDVSDSDGKSYGWHTSSKFSDLIFKGAIRVHIEMILANTLSEVVGNVVVEQNVSTSNMGIAVQGITQSYDRDNHGWTIKTDSHSERVRLLMVYNEIQNVPRNHLRYVSWTAYVLRFHGQLVEPIPLHGSPFSHYYHQDVSDEGIIMETDIVLKELREPGCPFLSDKGQLRIQVEWEESYLLFQATYHKYDDVGKIHNQQMRKEINSLQAENYSLERQLFSYQKSIAFAHSRGTYSDELVSPEVRPEEEDERYYEERANSAGDRSVSTDTDYA